MGKSKYIESNSLTDIKKIIDDSLEILFHIIIIDRFGRIAYINDNYCAFLGYKRQELLGEKVESVIPNTKLYDTLETGEPTFDDLFEFEDGRGLVYSRIPIKNHYGEIQGVISVSLLNSTDTLGFLYEEIEKLRQSNQLFIQQLQGLSTAPAVFSSIVGISPRITEIKNILARVTNTTMPILLTGESGTGKEVFAAAIHNASNRRGAPFVKVNCAAIPRELLESELFGYETGTFSGAVKGGKAGKFELANNGTILLDEIEELPLEMQSKLLRVLQEYEVERIGSIKPTRLNLQVICCSNKDLYQMTAEKKFREDLLYRINVLEIELPPLRERAEDLPLLASSLVDKINRKYKLDVTGLSGEALSYLQDYAWPGNVRELEHVIERACVLKGSGILAAGDFLFLEKKKKLSAGRAVESAAVGSFFKGKETAEKDLIQQALSATGGNKSKAAKELGISRSLLYAKIDKYGLK